MICSFTKINNYWICKECGRQSIVEASDTFAPVAMCRIPEDYRINQSHYLFEMKIKGVGDHLSTIFKQMGYSYEPISKTRTRITFLNKRSAKWCQENQHIIYSWIAQECKERNISFIPKVVYAIIRLAIIKTLFPSFSKT